MNREETFIIAEAGVNHNGSLDNAFALIDAAKESGSSAVKFQSFKASKLTTMSATQANYQIKNTNSNQTQYDLLKGLELKENNFKQLSEYCKKKNIQFLSTPFDSDYLDYLVDELGMDTIKVPSGEVTNAPFLLKVARKKKKIILSTGMCTLDEIYKALEVLAFGLIRNEEKPTYHGFKEAYESVEGQEALYSKVSILHCTTEYPAPYQETNLNVLHTYKNAFKGMRVGYSDHTLDIFIPFAAVALGAKVVEKHFTLDKKMPGPDHLASLEPIELKKMVEGIRCIEKAMGSYEKTPTHSEIKNKLIARKSLVAAIKIQKGQKLTEANLTTKRPGSGISPMDYWRLIGSKANKDYSIDDILEVE